MNLVYNFALFGDPLKFPQQLYSNGLHFFFDSSIFRHILDNLFSPYRGLFLISPILVLGIYGMYQMFRIRETRTDALLFASLFVVILVYYSSWQGWDGGWSYGPRFLILGIPYIAIPLAFLIPTLSKLREKIIFLALFGISCLVQELGAIVGSAPPTQSITQYQAISYALPQMLENNFALWWILTGSIGNPIPIVATTILIFAGIALIVGLTMLKNFRMDMRPNSPRVFSL